MRVLWERRDVETRPHVIGRPALSGSEPWLEDPSRDLSLRSGPTFALSEHQHLPSPLEHVRRRLYLALSNDSNDASLIHDVASSRKYSVFDS